MARGIYLDPKKTPAGTGFPPTVDELLRFIAEYMEVVGLDNILGLQVQESKPSNTSLPWLSTNSLGKPLGMFKFFDGLWVSVEHEKGDFKYQNLTGTLHPHWKFADNSINPGPINGVTIPTVTNRGLVAAAAGGKYNVGDTGGADDISLPHTHTNGQFNANGHTLISAEQGVMNMDTLSRPDSISGGDPIMNEILMNGLQVFQRSQGGSLRRVVVPANAAASAHDHIIPQHDTQETTPSFDNRSLYFGARLLIYVGVE